MHMLTVDGIHTHTHTHTHDIEDILQFFGILVSTTRANLKCETVVLMSAEVMTLVVTYSTKLSSTALFLSLPICIAA
jgi:hypothetical protein